MVQIAPGASSSWEPDAGDAGAETKNPSSKTLNQQLAPKTQDTSGGLEGRGILTSGRELGAPPHPTLEEWEGPEHHGACRLEGDGGTAPPTLCLQIQVLLPTDLGPWTDATRL